VKDALDKSKQVAERKLLQETKAEHNQLRERVTKAEATQAAVQEQVRGRWELHQVACMRVPLWTRTIGAYCVVSPPRDTDNRGVLHCPTAKGHGQ
jgi:hypothetical protein